MMIMARTSSVVTSALLTVPTSLAVEHDADPVRKVEDVVDVVADQEDADAFRLELLDQVADLGSLGGPEGGSGLVHDQDPGVEMDARPMAIAWRWPPESDTTGVLKFLKLGFRRPMTLRVADSMAASSRSPNRLFSSRPRKTLADASMFSASARVW
jgi:hypothetical protein